MYWKDTCFYSIIISSWFSAWALNMLGKLRAARRLLHAASEQLIALCLSSWGQEWVSASAVQVIHPSWDPQQPEETLLCKEAGALSCTGTRAKEQGGKNRLNSLDTAVVISLTSLEWLLIHPSWHGKQVPNSNRLMIRFDACKNPSSGSIWRGYELPQLSSLVL